MSIYVVPKGNLGNRALQYLTAKNIQRFSRKQDIRLVSLPEWKHVIEHPLPDRSKTLIIGEKSNWIDIAGVAECVDRGIIDNVQIESYAQFLSNYPPVDISRRLLPFFTAEQMAPGYQNDVLLCNIRGAEILRGVHFAYTPLPPKFYREVAEKKGINVVFYGQLADNLYTESLVKCLPDAKLVSGVSPEVDFDVIRRSRFIVPSVSSFSWLASWLSEASSVILPVAGLFHPSHHRSTDFLPLYDQRYEFYRFPCIDASDMYQDADRFLTGLQIMYRDMKLTTTKEFHSIQIANKAYQLPHVYLSGFDESFYLNRYPDLRVAAKRGEINALDHFLNYGFAEGRIPIGIDPHQYLLDNPSASEALSLGHFRDREHCIMASISDKRFAELKE